MQIGHINLAKSLHGAGENFVDLVEALQALKVQQHILVRNVTLAKRLTLIEGVTVGPAVRSAVMAYCLMPPVDVVHIHDPSEGQSGLLLTLTRAIPFVLTHREDSAGRNLLAQAVYRRASGLVYQGDADAAKHLRIYRHVIENWRAAAPSA